MTRKARSLTDKADADPKMPDALEIAAAQDREFAKTGKLVGPLHGVVMAIKDQYDTFDMRTTSGGDTAYANDRPPEDSTFVRTSASGRRDHHCQVESRRIRLGHPAQLLRRHVLQSVRHRAQPARFELGFGLRGRRESRHVLDRRGKSARRFAARPAPRAQSASRRTQELVSRKGMVQIGINTRVGPDLSHGGGCCARARCDRGLRSEG